MCGSSARHISLPLDTMLLGQEVGVLLVRSLSERAVLPQIGGKVGIRLGDGSVRGLGEITQSAGGTTGRRVAILNTSHGQQLLGHRRRNDASTARSRNQTHRDGTALAGNLNGVDAFCQLVNYIVSIIK